jgi:Zn-dependent M16 (insulinase) family peptidase
MAPPEELVSFDVAGIRARRWKYAESGLTVCHVKTSGPIVHGFLGIATEAHDDDGLPHTLEHLIFLGCGCASAMVHPHVGRPGVDLYRSEP